MPSAVHFLLVAERRSDRWDRWAIAGGAARAAVDAAAGGGGTAAAATAAAAGAAGGGRGSASSSTSIKSSPCSLAKLSAAASLCTLPRLKLGPPTRVAAGAAAAGCSSPPAAAAAAGGTRANSLPKASAAARLRSASLFRRGIVVHGSPRVCLRRREDRALRGRIYPPTKVPTFAEEKDEDRCPEVSASRPPRRNSWTCTEGLNSQGNDLRPFLPRNHVKSPLFGRKNRR